MRYVVAIGNFLFHIELYYCNKLNFYFTSNFVDVIEVSNWVTGRFEKLTLFFSLICSLSLMSILFFSLSSQYFSPHMSSLFLSSQFPTFSHHIYLPIFSHLKINLQLPIYFFFRGATSTIFLQYFHNKSLVVSYYWFKFEPNTKITFLLEQ